MKSMDFKQLLLNLFSNNKNPSIKRVSGFLGWIVCIIIVVYCQYFSIITIPIVESLFWFSTALLGLDSLVNTFSKKENIKEDNLDK